MEVRASELGAALAWAADRSRSAGTRGFTAALVADRLQTRREDVSRWLHILSITGRVMCTRSGADGLHTYQLRGAA